MATQFNTPLPSAKIILFPPDRVFRPITLVEAMRGAEACERMILYGTELERSIGRSMLPENERIIAEYVKHDGAAA